ncbi:MAG TPA: phosphoribosyltransferase family protein [Acidobacteriaceae bacterium]|nr:phosphoribosyltransferase family protein [Acidobacteriaceae bacterium]
MLFRDRADAGRRLSSLLLSFSGRDDVLVLALPRGGVPVAFEVARTLRCPLDVFVVRKLGAPDEPEYAIGAIASGGTRLVNETAVRELGIPSWQVEERIEQEEREIARREELYRAGRPAREVRNRVIIVVDDGIATGSTMRVAIAALRRQSPMQIVVAAPVASRPICQKLKEEADSVVFLATPPNLASVGEWYQDFSQTSDQQVSDLLSQASRSSQQQPA